VFAEILGILHRAETGTRPHAISASSSGASAAVALEGDLQLPRRVKVQRLKQLSSLSPLEGPSSPQAAAAAASPYAAALMAGVPSTAALSAAQDLATQRPATLVHGVFGLDIQMPCPPSDSDSRGSSGGGSGSRVARGGRRSPPPPSASVEPRSPNADGGLMEVQQFTKVSPRLLGPGHFII
jgi:hypothetical protein